MNKAIALKIIKHCAIFIIILLCLSSIPATFMAMSPFNDILDYEAWGFCEGYTVLDECSNDLYKKRHSWYYISSFFDWVCKKMVFAFILYLFDNIMLMAYFCIF